MEQVRSFVAIELPEGLKQELDELVARLSQGLPGIRWVDPHSIHLTLKFLGNVRSDRLDDITRALGQAVRGVAPLRLSVGGLSVFPNARRARVAWVGVSGATEQLQRLQRQVEVALAPLGFPEESRPFTPHLTLARIRDQAPLEVRQRLTQLLDGTTFTAAHLIEVDAIHLMRSQLTRQGALYSRISSVPLQALQPG